MTRRTSRAQGRHPDTGRPTADYATTTPPTDAPILRCARCGAIYRDYPESEAGHKTVYGHNPIRKTAPATAESAPEQHQEGAGWTG